MQLSEECWYMLLAVIHDDKKSRQISKHQLKNIKKHLPASNEEKVNNFYAASLVELKLANSF